MTNTEDTNKKKIDGAIFHSPVRAVFDKFSRHKDVSLVFGEPIDKGKRSVIPVAKLNYTFGGGGGGGSGPDGKLVGNAIGKGEGGGGHFYVKPIGVYEVTEKRVRFKPVYGLRLLPVVFSILTLGITFLLRKK